ncbi:unnamed protein product [Caenorhabditis auriculariae]|uniref:Peptidase C1A papain C-terminal domain-containing protein n=1 Tax=Caenorhabditis auriculariae TaxID=2777116 RepID=A0A8S1GVX2_9PELO|nr:unnamed protein product [Caenorhabditis auriculariae]
MVEMRLWNPHVKLIEDGNVSTSSHDTSNPAGKKKDDLHTMKSVVAALETIAIMLCCGVFLMLLLLCALSRGSSLMNEEKAVAPVLPPDGIFSEFMIFSEKNSRKYGSKDEVTKRLDAYKSHSERIETWKVSKEHGNVEYGHNDLSDWTDEEFENSLMSKSFYQRLRKNEFLKPVPESLAQMKGEAGAPFPDYFDWRDRNVVTPVKAQGKCGSCWAFASTATVEAAWAIAHGEKRNLSEQTLLDCDLDDNACDGGDEDKAFRFIHRNGLAYAADLPYVAHRQETCRVSSNWNTTKIKAAYSLHQDEESIINWLVNFGPVNIGMAVIQPMRAYKGGVFTPSAEACKNEVIGLHALLITGYGTSKDGEKYWIVKNSWGDTWGVENGYIYFARGINACGIEDEPIGILA